MPDENDDEDGEEQSDESDRSLWDHFNESAVQARVVRLKQNSAQKRIPIHDLLNGRGAASIWHLVDEYIKREPCLETVAMADFTLPFGELATLVNRAAPADEVFIESIRTDNHVSGLRLLPKASPTAAVYVHRAIAEVRHRQYQRR